MIHDPMCFVNNLCVECHCDLIALVRDDELHNYHMPAWTSGYLAALDAAEAAVAACTWDKGVDSNFDAVVTTVITGAAAAIRALKEKP